METTDTKGNVTDGIGVLGWGDMTLPLFCTFFDGSKNEGQNSERMKPILAWMMRWRRQRFHVI